MSWNKLSTYKTKIDRVGDVLYSVRYHDTAIVQCYDEAGRRVIQLDTGGECGDWEGRRANNYLTPGSVTTKRKMNQASNQFALGYSVHQHKHRWYVTTKAGVYAYEDNVFVFDADTGLPWGVVALFTEGNNA